MPHNFSDANAPNAPSTPNANAGVLFLLCGASFAGKTTLARALHHQLGAEIVSLDDILAERGLAAADGLPIDLLASGFAAALGRVEDLLACAAPVVLDDTLCYRFLRDRARQAADRAGAPCRLLYLDPGHDVVRTRRRQAETTRHRAVPSDEVFEAHLASFEPPLSDELPTVLRNAEEIETWLTGETRAMARPAG